jgi:hypothetical protein
MKRISHFWIEKCAVSYTQARAAHVRFGSKADIATGQRNVPFTPKADIGIKLRNVSFDPRADKTEHGV